MVAPPSFTRLCSTTPSDKNDLRMHASILSRILATTAAAWAIAPRGRQQLKLAAVVK